MQEMLGPLMLFAAAMCLTPGPNVVMSTASAVNFGFRHSIPQISGGLAAWCGISLVLWAGFGAAIARFLARPRVRTVFNYAMAGLLAASLALVFMG